MEQTDGKHKKVPTEVTELEKTIIELKNTLEGFKSRLDEEERISELEDKAWNSPNQSSK